MATVRDLSLHYSLIDKATSWGKLAMYAGVAGAVAAGGAAAYVNRGNITTGWSWASSHLEFVGCLMRSEELKTRMAAILAAQQDRGIGFANLYTVLGKGASGTGTSVAGGFVEVGGTDAKERTFCNMPLKLEWKKAFEGTVNNKASDEVTAHMNMFQPRENPGFYRLAEAAKGKVVGWVEESWYAGSERRESDDWVADEEPVLVEKS